MANSLSNRPMSLGKILVIVALGSLGTGAFTNGIYFLAEAAYGFGDRANLLLGVMLGGTYIAGALGIGPLLRRAAATFAWLSTRGLLAGILVLIGLSAAWPAVAAAVPGLSGSWSLWVSVVVFAPTSGALWPIVESYLAGGRRGRALVRAIGAFNIVWSIAVVASMWIMVGLIESVPMGVFVVIGGVHLLAAVVVIGFAPEPSRADPEAWPDEPHPETYRQLLAVFRVLLPTSYVLMSTLSPLLPGLLERLGVELSWKPAVASVWMGARVIAFVTLERWHGWHGRWSVPIVAVALMGLGFCAAMLAPQFGARGLAVLLVGLTVLGLGLATVYVGALYYGMEVGHGEVDAGGTHEAVIGLGYTLGPACGLLAGSFVGWDDPGSRDTLVMVMLGVLLAIGVPTVLFALLRHKPPSKRR